MKQNRLFIFFILIVSIILIASWLTISPKPIQSGFDGEQAYKDVLYQVSLGPRIPESQPHGQVKFWITEELKKYGWQVEVQDARQLGHKIQNVIAKRGYGKNWLILGAHYDTRQFADKDPNPDRQHEPVPGANDGASGVAVLLELGRKLPQDLPVEIWLVFFDAEDQGNIPGWDWILGSRSFVETLERTPNGVVIVDMIGDSDLSIYMEKNSDPFLTAEIWEQAEMLGYSQYFIPEYKYSILDDHIPFLEKGFLAVDLIDFDYQHWHTTLDTADKVSPESLKIVGETITAWMISKANQK